MPLYALANFVGSCTTRVTGYEVEFLDKIFDKFFQVEARKKGKKYGVGLGLAFCKMATEAQGGEIKVESEMGKGTTFTIILPTN